MITRIAGIGLLVVSVAYVGYGVVRFPPWQFHSPRLVRNPGRLFWTLPRLWDEREWTEEGLRFRRAFLRWQLGLVALFALAAWLL